MDRKINKRGPKRSTGNDKNKLKSSSEPTKGNTETMKEPKKSPIRRSWTRLHTGPRNKDGMEPIEVESDPKRKSEAITTDNTEATSKEKKQRSEEETRTLSILMATHLASAEDARQPRRVQ